MIDELTEDYPWDDEPVVYWGGRLGSFESDVEALNAYGEDGWEVVTIADGNEGIRCTFKRPVFED